jgi:hypothetical protein
MARQPFAPSPRYRLVRFEDVCDDSLPQADALFRWLGFQLPPSASHWITASTHATEVSELSTYSVNFFFKNRCWHDCAVLF